MSDTEIRFSLPGAARQPINGYLHVPPGDAPAPTILLAHGFKGWADYGFLPLMARALAQAGVAVVRFSFSHCGITGDGSTFDRPDLFENDTFASQIDDTLALLAAVRDGRLPAPARLDGSRLGMVGHSRGGVTAVLAAGQSGALKAIVTLASPERTLHDTQMRDQIRATGRIPILSTRTGQQLYIGRTVLDDIESAGERYDLLKLLGRYGGAFMAVHCQNDDTVGSEAAEHLAAAHTGGATELAIFPAGSHTFDFRHGQAGSTVLLDVVIARVGAFLLRYLS